MIMKIWLLSSTLFLCCHVFGQTGVVVLTEEFTLSAPFTAKIHVTMPNGTTSTTNITHEFTNVAQHDINLNNIINSIVNQGYKIIQAPEGWGFFGTPTSGALRRIFFGVP